MLNAERLGELNDRQDLGEQLVNEEGFTRLDRIFVDEDAAKAAAASFDSRKMRRGESIKITNAVAEPVLSDDGRKTGEYKVVFKNASGQDKSAILLTDDAIGKFEEKLVSAITRDDEKVSDIETMFTKLQQSVSDVSDGAINIDSEGKLEVELDSRQPLEAIGKALNSTRIHWLTNDDMPRVVDQVQEEESHSLKINKTVLYDDFIRKKQNNTRNYIEADYLDNIADKMVSKISKYQEKTRKDFEEVEKALSGAGINVELEGDKTFVSGTFNVAEDDVTFHNNLEQLANSLIESGFAAKVVATGQNEYRVLIDESRSNPQLNEQNNSAIKAALGDVQSSQQEYLVQQSQQDSLPQTVVRVRTPQDGVEEGFEAETPDSSVAGDSSSAASKLPVDAPAQPLQAGLMSSFATATGTLVGLVARALQPNSQSNAKESETDPRKAAIDAMVNALKKGDIAAFHKASEDGKQFFDTDKDGKYSKAEALAFREEMGAENYAKAKATHQNVMKDSTALASALGVASGNNDEKLAGYVAGKMDTNKDGKHSLDEVAAVAVAYKEMHGESFDQLAAKFKDFNMTNVAEDRNVAPAATEIAASGRLGIDGP